MKYQHLVARAMNCSHACNLKGIIALKCEWLVWSFSHESYVQHMYVKLVNIWWKRLMSTTSSMVVLLPFQ
jgi:hypothetical protein